jgi:outer membrane protein insertion porin family
MLFGRKYYFFLFLLFGCLQWLTSCNVTKHLDSSKAEKVLVKNKLKFTPQSKVSVGQRLAWEYETEGLFRQKPNKRFMGGYPRLSAHYYYKDRTSKFATFINNKYAEQPALFKEEACQISANYFQNFMRKRGYFNAVCTYQVKDLSPKKVEVTYLLDLGPLYTIGSLDWTSRDSSILQLLAQHKSESGLKVGKAVSSGSFEAEKARLVRLLRNSGYAQMVPNYIEFTGDSTSTAVKVGIEVLPFSAEKVEHPKFTIGNVAVFSSLVPDVNSIRETAKIEDVSYFSREDRFFVKPSNLHKAIKVQPGSTYNLDEIDLTYRKLSSLGAFRFVSVKPQADSLNSDKMDVNIFLAPANKMSIGPNIDLRYVSEVGLIGIPTSVFFKHRNLFRGAELLQTTLTGNVEFAIGPNQPNLIFLWETKLQNSLILPRFYDYLYIWKTLHALRVGNKRLVSNSLYKHLQNDSKANIGLNANLTSITAFFMFGQLDAVYGINLNSGNHSYAITHIGLDWLQYLDFSPRIDSIFRSNPLFALRNSDQLFTGFLMRSFSYGYRSKTSPSGRRFAGQASAEISGWEVEMLNQLFQPEKIWKLNNQLDFAKYIRLELNGTYTRNLSSKIMAGLNVSTGIVVPYGRREPGESRATPFVKQFSVGGPSSIRGWRIREIGPGRYYNNSPLVLGSDTPFFQASDFKFEFSSEVRFPIFWYLKGAIFLDGGNIWSLRLERERPGSQWYRNSWGDLALSSGAGLRFDFGYSVIRFDLGMKLRQPSRVNDDYSYWVNWRYKGNAKDFFDNVCNLNIAVGYPF